MHRIRMSLPYFATFGWEAEVVTVDDKYSELVKDALLLRGIPKETIIHLVKAFSKKWTSKIGLGSIALRSLFFYKRKINQILKKEKFDLIYFSTTQFPVLILGTYWKKKFNIPYVIDMQDPWHSTYYDDKPKAERPKKYWFSYRLNKYLEPIAMKNVHGLISVSNAYLDTLEKRYSNVKTIPKQVIPFGAFQPDFDFVKANANLFTSSIIKEKGSINFVYIGRGGYDMQVALKLLFSAFKIGLKESPEIYNKIRFHFIGTSYAPKGEGKLTIKPIADDMGLASYVYERTDRISFYESIYTMLTADVLLILGSDDPQYTASKIYPYILAEKPLLAFFHPRSSAGKIIQNCNAGKLISLIDEKDESIASIKNYLINTAQNLEAPKTEWGEFNSYTAENMTKNQVELFNKVVS
ncbi:glycosyltransferase [Pedobacter sp. UYP30]|uniref:glycosyltransferase n=1 Tax=Pedobacter sp. UYP30 TaxID=1756400 RepID=UPI00339923F7